MAWGNIYSWEMGREYFFPFLTLTDLSKQKKLMDPGAKNERGRKIYFSFFFSFLKGEKREGAGLVNRDK